VSPAPTAQGRTKTPLPLRLRRWVAAVFILVLAVFLAVFITREKKPGPGSVESGTVTSQKIDAREQVHYVEFRGEKEKIEFQADRNFIGPDNMYHLVGNVQVVDFGRQGGRRVEIHCDEIIHDPNRSRFNLMGRVQVNFEEATFETETLVYTRKEDEFSTEKDILIASPRFKGSARGMRYSLKTQDLSFLGAVRLETRASERSPLPLVILSRELSYNRSTRKGRFAGGVNFAHGRSHGSAEAADFQLFADVDILDIINLTGRVRAFLDGEFAGRAKGPGQSSFLTLGEKQSLEADEVRLRAFLNSSELHSYESKGRASITFISSTKGATRFQAGSIDFIFDPGVLREFRGSTDVRMLKTEPSGETQSAEGDSMFMPGNSDVLQIKGTKARPVRARFRSSAIEASVLGFDLKTEDLQSASIKAVFSPAAGKKPAGLFSAEEPVFVTSRWMKYDAKNMQYRFYGGMKMWQNRSELFAKEAEVREDTGGTLCREEVRSLFPHKPKDGSKEERVEIMAGEMRYDPDRSLAVYEKTAEMRTSAFRLTAARIEVLLSGENKEPRTVTALDNVNIVQGAREGKGGQAVYLVDDRLVVLTGRPTVTEKDKGEVQGDKLTFHLADDTITVENDKRDRSLTKIK
jgi:LPS export ABC transporter protein LptC/lipopolysaccharide transport protein LptA